MCCTGSCAVTELMSVPPENPDRDDRNVENSSATEEYNVGRASDGSRDFLPGRRREVK